MLPMVAILASIVLLALLAARHFASVPAGGVAVAVFATMPVVWLASSGGATQVVLVPFIVALMLCVQVFVRGGGPMWLGLAGGAAAAMLYVHLAGVVMAPIHLAVAALIMLPRRDRFAAIGALAAGFAITAAPWAVSALGDPQSLSDSINAYGLYDANRFNPLQGMREITSWVGLTVRSEVYWDSFSPALLFLGDGSLWQSLVGSSVFLLPLAIPLARGLLAYVVHPRDAMDLLVLGMFVTAPAAVALMAQTPSAPRLILLAPAAAIVATRGCYPGAFRTTAAGSPATPETAVTTR